MAKRARDYYPSKYEAARKRRAVGTMLQSVGIRRRLPPRAITVVPRSYGNARAITERKYFETELNNSTLAQVTTAWTTTIQDPATTLSYFNPRQGNDVINRIGRKVKVIEWKIRGFINCIPVEGATTGTDPAYIRLIFFLDHQTNGAVPVGTQVIESNQVQATPAAPAICAWQNKNNFGRFKVLKDRSFALQNPSMGSTGATFDVNGLMIPFKYTFKFKKPLDIIFNQTDGGTIADIVNTSLHCMAGQNNVDLQASINLKSRVVFLDS